MRSRSKPVILFPHIAKTAGVTAVTLLDRAFGGHTFGGYFQEKVSGTGLVDLNFIASKFDEIPEEKREQVQFIPGHMGFGLHQHLPFDCKYITFIRDPVGRIISSYNYVRELGWYCPELSFEDFVNEGFLGSNNHMVRALSGDPSLDTFEEPALRGAVRQVTEADFQRTIQNIEKHFVSCIPVSSFDAGLIDFFCEWNLQPAGMLYERQNVTRTKQVRQAQLSEEVLQQVRELNEFDLRLYDYVGDAFKKKYQLNRRRYSAITEKFSGFQSAYQKVAKLQMQDRASTEGEPYQATEGASFQADAESLKDQIGVLANRHIQLRPSNCSDRINYLRDTLSGLIQSKD